MQQMKCPPGLRPLFPDAVEPSDSYSACLRRKVGNGSCIGGFTAHRVVKIDALRLTYVKVRRITFVDDSIFITRAVHGYNLEFPKGLAGRTIRRIDAGHGVIAGNIVSIAILAAVVNSVRESAENIMGLIPENWE
ncbi:hypothetical protein ACHAW5_010794 [Stephanodiscus triporus]|uniref:Uncharacterized protein n=1 Tax=Stephanodiscus triporus TaxID=2934178 RepID=A0ABD3Q2H8_9STRA